MDRKLSYNGKEVSEMSQKELREQLRMNQVRLNTRVTFFILVAWGCAVVNPFLAIIPIGICLVTRYWLLQNIYEIKAELKKR